MSNTHFTNVRVFDGTGAEPFEGEVLVQGNRIKEVAAAPERLDPKGAETVDGGGATLMPGLINGHCHMSYTGNAYTSATRMGDIPVEEHMLITAYQAKVLLDAGFTACVGAGAAKPRLDIVIRNEIDAGRVPGPRYRAASPEITVTGGLGDERKCHIEHNDLSLFVDGPEEVRQTCRWLIREGVDTIKLMISGDNLIPGHCAADQLAMDEDEVAAGSRVAHQRGRALAAHARSPESIKLCVKYGIERIYHGTLADEESLDLLESRKDEFFVVPALGFTYATAFEAAEYGITPAMAESWGFTAEYGIACETMRKMHARGIRVLPFGDYGFPWTPHGTDTRDFEIFRDELGFTPAEILRAATMYGGQIFRAGDELGQIKQGHFADMIMIDGDPLADLSLFRDPDHILMVMKDGSFHKAPTARGEAERQAAAAE